MCSTLPTSNVIRTGCSNVIRTGYFNVIRTGYPNVIRIGYPNVIRIGCSNVIRIGHSVVKSGKTAKVVNYVGRPTGIMVRPVKYVRVQK